MPIILIETQAGWITEPVAVIEAVYSAVQNVLSRTGTKRFDSSNTSQIIFRHRRATENASQ
jgi:hypothetical protein